MKEANDNMMGWIVSPVLGEFVSLNIQKEKLEAESQSSNLKLNITFVNFKLIFFPLRGQPILSGVS